MSAAAERFEAQRAFLCGLAYRMLGSHAESEDVVQDAWLRWREVEHDAVANPQAYLARVVTRLALDRLKSAQHQRELYVGPWLPEPVVEEQGLWAAEDANAEFGADLSYAFMLALERLSPLERAAFLLHDVFDADFAEVAATLQRSEAACRQLAARARTHVRASRPRFRAAPEEGQRLAAAFLAASQSGDLAQLKALLSEDVRMLADGGGQVAAIGIPLQGRERVIKVVLGIARKYPPQPGSRVQACRVNGLPGVLIRAADGTPVQTMAFEIDAAARIAAIYVVRNPDKLRALCH